MLEAGVMQTSLYAEKTPLPAIYPRSLNAIVSILFCYYRQCSDDLELISIQIRLPMRPDR